MSHAAPSPTVPASDHLYAMPDEARAFATRVLAANGLPPDDARTVADCLIRADLRGVDTHGLQYLPHYLKRVRMGLINATPSLSVQKVTPVAGLLDGQNAFGFVVASRAMAEAIEMARDFGIGLVSVRHSTHFGMAACYVLQAVEAGYIALVFTNASPAMPPWGGRQALLGTSPLAAGVPGGAEGPYVLDMSPAVAARGKVRRAARHGQEIPLGYALDAQGRPTTDPQAALDGGVVLPIGGPKGSALSMLMDILGGVLSGAAYAGDVGNQFEVFDRPQDVGHFFLAIKPDLFVTRDEFLGRMDTLVRRVHDCPKAEGFNEILMPGELEARLEAARVRTGIPYNPGDMAAIQREAAEAGLPPLAVSDKPITSPTSP
jgi:LDH2 family malate/lactate/ureidoglycolate dehydrogenase